MSNLVIYDDTVSTFTEPQHLQHIYGKFWDNGLPISIGMTPVVRGTSGISSVPEPKRASTATYRLSENTILCNYLGVMAEQRLVEICQHGFYGTVDEFNTDDDVLLQQKIEEGQAELKRAFPNNDIKTICAPSQKLSDTAIQLLTEYDFNICAYSEDDTQLNKRISLNDSRAMFHTHHHQDFANTSSKSVKALLQHILTHDITVLRLSYTQLIDAKKSHPAWQQFCDQLLSQKAITIDTFAYI